MMFLYQIMLKMDQKGHKVDQKGLTVYEKRQNIEFLDLKYLFLAEFSLAELRVPPPPLRKNPLSSFLTAFLKPHPYKFTNI